MYLGNIVSENKIQNNLFNCVDKIEDIDRRIPTLIIGWDFSKRIVTDKKLTILDKKINSNTSWTFTKREKRIEYEKDFEFFTKKTLKLVEKSVNYSYLNVLTAEYSMIKKMINLWASNEVSYIYICNNSFVYSYTNDDIIGVDLNMIDFLNIDRKKVYKLLFSGGNKVIFSDEFLPKYIKENIDINYKIIPYLYAIENDKK